MSTAAATPATRTATTRTAATRTAATRTATTLTPVAYGRKTYEAIHVPDLDGTGELKTEVWDPEARSESNPAAGYLFSLSGHVEADTVQHCLRAYGAGIDQGKFEGRAERYHEAQRPAEG